MDLVRLRRAGRAPRVPGADQHPGRRRPACARDPFGASARGARPRRGQWRPGVDIRANGVGPKLASRIANELQGKLAPASPPAWDRPRPAREPRRMPCPPSPTSASSPPTPAPRSTPPRTSSARMPRSTRSSGWRCARRRNEKPSYTGSDVHHRLMDRLTSAASSFSPVKARRLPKRRARVLP